MPAQTVADARAGLSALRAEAGEDAAHRIYEAMAATLPRARARRLEQRAGDRFDLRVLNRDRNDILPPAADRRHCLSGGEGRENGPPPTASAVAATCARNMRFIKASFD